MFAGEQFENDADFRQAKAVLLDMFRGRLVDNINLKARPSTPSMLGIIETLTSTVMCRMS